MTVYVMLGVELGFMLGKYSTSRATFPAPSRVLRVQTFHTKIQTCNSFWNEREGQSLESGPPSRPVPSPTCLASSGLYSRVSHLPDGVVPYLMPTGAERNMSQLPAAARMAPRLCFAQSCTNSFKS